MTDNQPKYTKKDIGALWSKRGAKGDYLSGYIEINGVRQSIVCFINSRKKEVKHPDYNILPAEKRVTTEAEDRQFDRDFDAQMEKEKVEENDEEIYPDGVDF